MKKILRWAAASVAFLLVGLLLFGHISEIFRKKAGGLSDMVHSFYELEEDSLDVLCMGSSHGYSSFQPNVLWKEHGLTSYSLCSPRQTAALTYYLLQEALQYQKPKVLLLESYYLFTNRKYTDTAVLRMAFDGVRPGRAKYEMIEDVLQDKGFKEKLTYYIPFLKYHSRWSELTNSDFNSDEFLKGSIMEFGIHSMKTAELPEKSRNIPKNARLYLDKIIELCRNEGIELVVYAAPYGYTKKVHDKYLSKQAVNNALETYLAEKEIPFLYYQKTGEAGIDYATDFRDYAHLNFYGAEKITRSLGSYLSEHYECADHREDERYQSWWDDYAEYEQEKQEKQEQQEQQEQQEKQS